MICVLVLCVLRPGLWYAQAPDGPGFTPMTISSYTTAFLSFPDITTSVYDVFQDIAKLAMSSSSFTSDLRSSCQQGGSRTSAVSFRHSSTMRLIKTSPTTQKVTTYLTRRCSLSKTPPEFLWIPVNLRELFVTRTWPGSRTSTPSLISRSR
ncbi:hypothetical protein F4780DRAFT_19096 [Xylariomycetidae sp. FL0641]|nr:hypothetical protein F4780DRAFT_19096 [Xylariomycetidae sp. FL0641]